MSLVDQMVDRFFDQEQSSNTSKKYIVRDWDGFPNPYHFGRLWRFLSSQGSQFITKANKSLKIARDEFKEVNRILGI